jgi:hypothetical protein
LEQIAESAAAALLAILDADFVHVTLQGAKNDRSAVVTRAGSRIATAFVTAAEGMLRISGPRRSEQTASFAGSDGQGELRIVSTPIGFTEKSMLVAGSLRSGFPSERERLLLGTAANGVTIALNRWQTETQGQRLVTIIERSSDFIGFATMDGTPQYINPAGRKWLALLLARRFHTFEFSMFLPRMTADARSKCCCPSCVAAIRPVATRV